MFVYGVPRTEWVTFPAPIHFSSRAQTNQLQCAATHKNREICLDVRKLDPHPGCGIGLSVSSGPQTETRFLLLSLSLAKERKYAKMTTWGMEGSTSVSSSSLCLPVCSFIAGLFDACCLVLQCFTIPRVGIPETASMKRSLEVRSRGPSQCLAVLHEAPEAGMRQRGATWHVKPGANTESLSH